MFFLLFLYVIYSIEDPYSLVTLLVFDQVIYTLAFDPYMAQDLCAALRRCFANLQYLR
jgi:hypothetical protein